MYPDFALPEREALGWVNSARRTQIINYDKDARAGTQQVFDRLSLYIAHPGCGLQQIDTLPGWHRLVPLLW
jgi:hypothetical protein